MSFTIVHLGKLKFKTISSIEIFITVKERYKMLNFMDDMGYIDKFGTIRYWDR
jgi:hypothetical protein